MDSKLRELIQSVKNNFPVSDIFVFGSHARGDANPDSDIDLLVVFTEVNDDLFELAYQVRRFLHERSDLALDVVVTTDEAFQQRCLQPWTVEYTARSEGIAV
ncbi:MAG: nucleotidyltransferase domain-containing protein [Spirochaeta sp.]|nr:nucleotidyltransferase domain-containing protein [Spirochaeta sp.]